MESGGCLAMGDPLDGLSLLNLPTLDPGPLPSLFLSVSYQSQEIVSREGALSEARDCDVAGS